MAEDKKIFAELTAKGVLDPSEVPFDEDENKAPTFDDMPTLPHTMQLIDPFEFGKGDKIQTLVFLSVPSAAVCLHLPVGGEIKFGHYVPIIGHCTGQPDALIKKLSFRDFRKAVEVVSHFLLPTDE